MRRTLVESAVTAIARSHEYSIITEWKVNHYFNVCHFIEKIEFPQKRAAFFIRIFRKNWQQPLALNLNWRHTSHDRCVTAAFDSKLACVKIKSKSHTIFNFSATFYFSFSLPISPSTVIDVCSDAAVLFTRRKTLACEKCSASARKSSSSNPFSRR